MILVGPPMLRSVESFVSKEPLRVSMVWQASSTMLGGHMSCQAVALHRSKLPFRQLDLLAVGVQAVGVHTIAVILNLATTASASRVP